jgi:hypothetical protein
MRSAAILAAVLLAGMSVSQAATKVYRWTDKDGHVHFTDQPPAHIPSTAVDISAPATAAAPAANGGDDAAAAADQGAKPAAEDCQKLKDKLASYKSADKITETDALGNVRTFSAEDRKKLLELTEQKMRTACGDTAAP